MRWMVLVAGASYLALRAAPQEPAELIGHDVFNLAPDGAPADWALTAADGSRTTVAVAPAMAVHDPGLLLDLAEQGLGIAAAPLLCARDATAAGRRQHVLPALRGQTPIHAIYPSRRMLAPKVRAFVEFAAEAMAAACRPCELTCLLNGMNGLSARVRYSMSGETWARIPATPSINIASMPEFRFMSPLDRSPALRPRFKIDPLRRA